MNTPQRLPSTRLAPLVFAWLALITLTLLSLGLGEWLRDAPGLPALVAAIVWFKAWLVADYFLETPLSHAFIAFAPIALVLTDMFGRQFAELMQL